MKPKMLVVILLAVTAIAGGAIGQYFFQRFSATPAEICFMIANAILYFIWYRIDAKQRAYAPSKILDVFVVGLSIVGLPYYFFRTRGAWKGALASAAFLLSAVALAFLTTLGQYATYFAFQNT